MRSADHSIKNYSFNATSHEEAVSGEQTVPWKQAIPGELYLEDRNYLEKMKASTRDKSMQLQVEPNTKRFKQNDPLGALFKIEATSPDTFF